MPVAFICPFCRCQGVAGDDSAGKRFNCPNCAKAIALPPLADPSIISTEAVAERDLASFFCVSCNHPLQGIAGEKLNCPHCGQRLLVPQRRENKTVLGSLEPAEEIFEAPVAEHHPIFHAPPFPPPAQPTVPISTWLAIGSYACSAIALFTPMLLAHGPAILAIALAVAGLVASHASKSDRGLILVCIALGFSLLTFYLIERHMEDIRNRLQNIHWPR